MRSRTSCFEPTLFRKTLLRFWPVWLGYALVWALLFPVALGGALSRGMSTPGWSYGDLLYRLEAWPYSLAFQEGLFLALVFACISAMCVYSHLYSARNAGAYAVLPARRACVFASVSAAGLLPLLAANLLVFLLALAVEAVAGVVYLPALLGWLGIVCLADVAFFGLAALCAQLTGSLVVLPLVYAVLNFTATVVEWLVRSLLETFVYGFASGDYWLEFLSPLVGISSFCSVETQYVMRDGAEVADGYLFHGWGPLAAYAGVGLLLLSLALLLYHRRRMETAGDVVAVGWLRPVFKYCLAFGCALCLGTAAFSLIYGGSPLLAYYGDDVVGTAGRAFVLLLLMLAGAFVGYFAAEMLMRKSFAVFRGGRRWLGYLAVCAVCALALLSCEYDLWGYERRVPDETEVVSVRVSAAGTQAELTASGNVAAALELHRAIAAHKDVHEAALDARVQAFIPEGPARLYAEGTTDFDRVWRVSFDYTLADGRTLSRRYDLRGSIIDGEASTCIGDLYAMQALLNTGEARAQRYGFLSAEQPTSIFDGYVDYYVPSPEDAYGYENLALTEAESWALYYGCLLPDLDASSLGDVWLVYDERYYETVLDCYVGLSFSWRGTLPEDRNYEYLYLELTADAAHTLAWLRERGVEPVSVGEAARTRYAPAATAAESG